MSCIFTSKFVHYNAFKITCNYKVILVYTVIAYQLQDILLSIMIP